MRLNLVPEMDWRETGASGEPETAGVDWVPSQVARGEAVSYLLLDLLSVSCFRGECTCLSVCMFDCMYVCFFVYGAYAQLRSLFECTDVCVHFFLCTCMYMLSDPLRLLRQHILQYLNSWKNKSHCKVSLILWWNKCICCFFPHPPAYHRSFGV